MLAAGLMTCPADRRAQPMNKALLLTVLVNKAPRVGAVSAYATTPGLEPFANLPGKPRRCS
jgi:hypothetical protein